MTQAVSTAAAIQYVVSRQFPTHRYIPAAPKSNAIKIVGNMRTFVIRSPSPDSAELVIGNGDHTCQVFPLTYEQIRLINAQAARAVAYWPAEPQVIAGD